MTMTDPKTDFSNVQLCTCMNLRKASRAVTQYFDQCLQPSGLRATQFTILAAAANTGEIGISQLAKRLVMDRTTLTRNLRPLIKQDLIEMMPGSDQRTRILTLSKKGRLKMERAETLWRSAQAHFIEGLGRDSVAILFSKLTETIQVAGNR